MPIIAAYTSRGMYNLLAQKREVLGNQWRECVHSVVGGDPDDVTTWWFPWEDAQNPLGIELHVWLSTAEVSGNPTELVRDIKRVLQEAIASSTLLPARTKGGVWPLVNEFARFGLATVGQPVPKE